MPSVTVLAICYNAVIKSTSKSWRVAQRSKVKFKISIIVKFNKMEVD